MDYDFEGEVALLEASARETFKNAKEHPERATEAMVALSTELLKEYIKLARKYEQLVRVVNVLQLEGENSEDNRASMVG
jgi:hypothetical protein